MSGRERAKSIRRVPERFSTGLNKHNAQAAWLDGFDTAAATLGEAARDADPDTPRYGNGLCVCGHTSARHACDHENADYQCSQCGCDAFRSPTEAARVPEGHYVNGTLLEPADQTIKGPITQNVLRHAPAPSRARRDYVALLQKAKSRVVADPLYRRFIEHTPLENDIAVWMADFACDEVAPLTPAAPDVVERLKAFAKSALLMWHNNGECGDIDGGWVQDEAVRLKLIAFDEDGGDYHFPSDVWAALHPARTGDE